MDGICRGLARKRPLPTESEPLELRPASIVDALGALLREVGASVLFGHSLGAALASKVIDVEPDLITALVAISPAVFGNVPTERSPAPPGQLVVLDRTRIDIFTNSDRFPGGFIDDYERSLCPLSPAVHNARGDMDGEGALVIDEIDKLRALPRMVVVGEQDRATPPAANQNHRSVPPRGQVVTGPTWGIEGFGHMIPIELGSEEIHVA